MARQETLLGEEKGRSLHLGHYKVFKSKKGDSEIGKVKGGGCPQDNPAGQGIPVQDRCGPSSDTVGDEREDEDPEGEGVEA